MQGDFFEYFDNGNIKTEGYYIDGIPQIKNHWGPEGDQLVKEGIGLYISEYEYNNSREINKFRYEKVYKNYRQNGLCKYYINGLIDSISEMKDDKCHGIRKTYYKNGRLKENAVLKDDILLSREVFPMVDNPEVKTKIICSMEDEWLINRKLKTADTYPVPLNIQDAEETIVITTKLYEHYGHDRELSCTYFISISNSGSVTSWDFLSTESMLVKEAVEESISNLKFTPAIKNNTAVNSYLIINYYFELIEKL